MTMQTQEQIDGLNRQAADLEQEAARLRQRAYDAKIERLTAKQTDMREWLGFGFQSSSGPTSEFGRFFSQLRAAIARTLGPNYTVTLKKGHFDAYGFATNKTTERMVYLSIEDVRFFPDAWFHRMMIRTARDDHDFTGGRNHETSLGHLLEMAEWLTTDESEAPEHCLQCASPIYLDGLCKAHAVTRQVQIDTAARAAGEQQAND